VIPNIVLFNFELKGLRLKKNKNSSIILNAIISGLGLTCSHWVALWPKATYVSQVGPKAPPQGCPKGPIHSYKLLIILLIIELKNLIKVFNFFMFCLESLVVVQPTFFISPCINTFNSPFTPWLNQLMVDDGSNYHRHELIKRTLNYWIITE